VNVVIVRGRSPLPGGRLKPRPPPNSRIFDGRFLQSHFGISCDAATPLLEEEIPENRIEGMAKLICLQIVGSNLCIISVSTEASERKRKHIWAKLLNKSNNVKIPLYT